MKRSEYERMKDALSIMFLTLKENGRIDRHCSWATWCLSTGVYPLIEDTNETENPTTETARTANKDAN